jgi:hypothetical protein
MNGIETFYETHPEKYRPEKIENLNFSKPQFRNMTEKQREHIILHLNHVVRQKALEELHRLEAERAQRNREVREERVVESRYREPRILVPVGVFFDLVEKENRGVE